MNDYKVYKHTSPSGKVYIGITKQEPTRRWQNGYGYYDNRKFMNAIRKYGWDNFTHEILHSGLTKEEAERIEVELIAKYDCIKNGYNLRPGGSATEHSEETKQKISEIAKSHNFADRLNTPQANAKKIPWGRVQSEETRKKIGDSHRGKKSVSAKRVKQLNLDGSLVRIWDCIMDVERECGYKNGSISRCCVGKRPTAYGYRWEHCNE